VAPLPANNTARFRIFYTLGGEQHSLQIRSAQSPAVVGADVDNLLTSLGTAIYNLVIDFVEFSAVGSTVFNPVTTGIEGNTYGGGSPTAESRAYALNFIGRTPGGRRVRIMVFGPTTLGGDYRFIAGEGASIDAGVAALVAAGSHILGIDGQTPVWKTYVNSLVNAHWQKALRP